MSRRDEFRFDVGKWLIICIPGGMSLLQLVRESTRFKQLLIYNAIVGVPHATDEDDIYNGYLIPKGSVVVGNA